MIQKEQVVITPFGLERTLHIYLPKNYHTSVERYPVMYMFDGHNLFHDEEATYGTSWGLEAFLDAYDKHFIIVGIECNHQGYERLSEFSPYTFSSPSLGNIYGKGDQLMNWMVNTLKPQIDREFRTMPFRECTGIGGSSMGGLMALYGVICHNTIFSKAACLSSAIFGCRDQMIEDIRKMNLSPDTRIYLSLGSEEIKNGYFLNQRAKDMNILVDLLDKKQVTAWFNLVEGGKHNEASWSKENADYFNFLWKS